MSLRKLLLALGVIFVVAGLALLLVWMRSMTQPASPGAQQEAVRAARLVALRDLPTGTLLRPGDFGWKELPPGPLPAGSMMRGLVSEMEVIGALTRRPFAEGEALVALELVKPGDRRFLAAVLRADHRAVSIAVDAPQTSSGLMLAGDYVDVILTQNFGDNVSTTGRRSVSETILRNVRVVAIDHSLGPQTKAAGDAAMVSVETRIPKTVSLEVTERQAQALAVSTQLGKIQLALRALEGSGATQAKESARRGLSTWASDISPALRYLARSQALAELKKSMAEMLAKVAQVLVDLEKHKAEMQAKAIQAEAELKKRKAEMQANAYQAACNAIAAQGASGSGIWSNIRRVPPAGCLW